MQKLLTNKVALITGSGRGIGRATACVFALEGARVVVSDIDSEPAEQTVADIKSAGGDAIAYVGDVTSPGFAEGIVAAAVERVGSAAHHRKQRGVHLGRTDPQDDRRSVGQDFRFAPQGAVSESFEPQSRTSARLQRKKWSEEPMCHEK